MKKGAIFLVTIFFNMTASATLPPYFDTNNAKVSFDVSMPIDSTGYLLHGKNLMGGDIRFVDRGAYLSPFLAHEVGKFELPIVTDLAGKPLIKTTINYDVIKLINPIGIDNFFIKIGMAKRTEQVSGLDPTVLKNGTYTWRVPIFSVGRESDTVNHTSNNVQFIQVGSMNSAGNNNAMYTQDVYLYSAGEGSTAIVGHPVTTARFNETLPKPYASHFSCDAEGMWGAGGSDPYRTIKGHCEGSALTFPAGPNLDYEYGSFKFPTVYTPWNGASADHCLIKGKKHVGCVNAKIDSSIRYMAQKIRVPLNEKVGLFAEFGTAYRQMTPDNLRYVCTSNRYLKNILPQSECMKKSYLPGGSAYTYFAVGYEFKNQHGTYYSTRYINIPGQENGNRLAWIDASNTQIYATSVIGHEKESSVEIQKNLNEALAIIRKYPAIYDILGKNFFAKVRRKGSD